MVNDDEKIESKIAANQPGEVQQSKIIWCKSCGTSVPLDSLRTTEGTQMFVTVICPGCGGEILPPTTLAPASFRRVEKGRANNANPRARREEP